MDNGESSYRRFRNGDESTFDEVLDTYRESLIFFINRYTRDLSAAEDIAIDVFTELIIHRHRYNFKSSLKTYLFTIGRRRAVDFLRRKSRVKITPLSEAENLAESATFEDRILKDEIKRTVNSAIEKLPDNMRIAVHLIYFEGLTYDEAAGVMKKNRKQVDNLLYRAKKELRSIIGEEGRKLL